MSTLDQRIDSLNELGKLFKYVSNNNRDSVHEFWVEKLQEQITLAFQYNSWFTKEYILLSFNNWSKELNKNNLKSWVKNYNTKDCSDKTIAIIMAGNLPLVGFHDFICAVLLNYNCLIKLSSDDKILIPVILDFIESLIPGFKNKVKFVDKPLEKFHGVIATGSNTSFKYFEYYFKKYPKLLRKNRHSIAILDGKESKNDLKNLGKDIFNYFGMGCRSVSKVFVPSNYNFDLLFSAIYQYKEIINHNKYANNYDYNKAVYLMSEQKFIENGFLMIKEENKLGSPIACLFYEKYNSISILEKKVKKIKNSLQCVVSNLKISNSIAFGSSQNPKINDYADNIDTLKFLLKI
jgi:hypothetical protein